MTFQIIDQETRIELAELGIETRERTRACMDCRFMKESPGGTFRECMARGGLHIEMYRLNMNGLCELWEKSDKIARQRTRALATTHPVVKLWAWTSFVAIIWLLIRSLW